MAHKSDKLLLVLVCGDDSSDSKRQIVMAIGALAGLDHQWARFKERWKAVNGDVVFHSSDCECDRGLFKNRTHEENLALYRKNIELIVESELIGFGVAIDVRAYRSVADQDLASDVEFYLCLADFMNRCQSLRVLSDRPVEAMFDCNADRDYTAGFLYEQIRKQRRMEGLIANRISFASREESIEVQAADIIAREIMKDMLNEITESKRTRRSFRAIQDTGRFQWTRLNREWVLENTPQNTPEVSAMIKAEYAEWLSQRRLSGNVHDSLRFLLSKDPAIFEDYDDEAI